MTQTTVIFARAPARNCPIRATAAAFPLSFVCASVAAEPYIGQFELKTLESAPASVEFQSQNAWSWGQPSRRVAADAEGVEFDENEVIRQRHAVELEMGFTSTLKMRVGVEFERERVDEPVVIEQANAFDELELTELGAELIAVLVPREADGAGFGVVVELEGPLDQESPNNLVLGAILEYQSSPWSLAAVPMLVHHFGGDTSENERADNKWDLAYAAQIAYAFSDSWTLALEGYGTVDRLRSTGHASDAAELFGDFDQHRLGPVLYYKHEFGSSEEIKPATSESLASHANPADRATLSMGVGLLEGLNDDTADHTLKISIEVDF